jgi:hypothetical protein
VLNEPTTGDTASARSILWADRAQTRRLSASRLEAEVLMLVGQLPFLMGMCDAEQKGLEGDKLCPVPHLNR